MTVTAGHNISETVKEILLEKNSRIIDVMVHLEPVSEKNQESKNQEKNQENIKSGE